MQFINQFSFLILAGLLLLTVGWVILHRTTGAARWLSLGAFTLGLIFSFWIFNPGPGNAVAELDLDNRQVGEGPVLLEFESPFCLGCIAAQSLVGEITREYIGQLDVIQINILAADSARLKDRYRIQFTPTFVFLTAHGEEAWRSIGTVDPEQVRASVTGDS